MTSCAIKQRNNFCHCFDEVLNKYSHNIWLKTEKQIVELRTLFLHIIIFASILDLTNARNLSTGLGDYSVRIPVRLHSLKSNFKKIVRRTWSYRFFITYIV